MKLREEKRRCQEAMNTKDEAKKGIEYAERMLKVGEIGSEKLSDKVKRFTGNENELADEIDGVVSGGIGFLGLGGEDTRKHVWPMIKKEVEDKEKKDIIVENTPEICEICSRIGEGEMNKNFRTIPDLKLNWFKTEDGRMLLEIRLNDKTMGQEVYVWYELLMFAMRLSVIVGRPVVLVGGSIVVDDSDGSFWNVIFE